MSIQIKTINGITQNTTKHLLLDAGAFFVGYNPATDTFESAKTAGKLLGATKGGGSFKAVPKFRTIDFDGVRGKIKGSEILESWDVSLTANVIETTPITIKRALGIATLDSDSGVENYTKITGKQVLELTDYADNITWVGTLSGSEKPVIVQIFNALAQKGLELDMADKSEGIIQLDFKGYYEAEDLDTPPFTIYYPKLG